MASDSASVSQDEFSESPRASDMQNPASVEDLHPQGETMKDPAETERLQPQNERMAGEEKRSVSRDESTGSPRASETEDPAGGEDSHLKGKTMEDPAKTTGCSPRASETEDPAGGEDSHPEGKTMEDPAKTEPLQPQERMTRKKRSVCQEDKPSGSPRVLETIQDETTESSTKSNVDENPADTKSLQPQSERAAGGDESASPHKSMASPRASETQPKGKTRSPSKRSNVSHGPSNTGQRSERKRSVSQNRSTASPRNSITKKTPASGKTTRHTSGSLSNAKRGRSPTVGRELPWDSELGNAPGVGDYSLPPAEASASGGSFARSPRFEPPKRVFTTNFRGIFRGSAFPGPRE